MCFSREEQGLVGSGAYAREAYQRGDSIVGALNFDMVGYVDHAPEDIDVIYNGASGWLADALRGGRSALRARPAVDQEADARPVGERSRFLLGLRLLATCDIEDSNISNPYYHRTTDRVSTLNFDFYTDVVKAAVATLAEAGADRLGDRFGAGRGRWRGLKVTPNPGSGEISIRMAAPAGSAGRVGVYDCRRPAGENDQPRRLTGVPPSAIWLGDDASGAKVSPGIYFVQRPGHRASGQGSPGRYSGESGDITISAGTPAGLRRMRAPTVLDRGPIRWDPSPLAPRVLGRRNAPVPRAGLAGTSASPRIRSCR